MSDITFGLRATASSSPLRPSSRLREDDANEQLPRIVPLREAFEVFLRVVAGDKAWACKAFEMHEVAQEQGAALPRLLVRKVVAAAAEIPAPLTREQQARIHALKGELGLTDEQLCELSPLPSGRLPRSLRTPVRESLPGPR